MTGPMNIIAAIDKLVRDLRRRWAEECERQRQNVYGAIAELEREIFD